MIYTCVFYLQVTGRAAQQVQEQHAAAADLLPALLRPACEEINLSPFRLILRCTTLSLFLIYVESSNELQHLFCYLFVYSSLFSVTFHFCFAR